MEAIFKFKILEESSPVQMLRDLFNNPDFRPFLWEHKGKEVVMTISPAAVLSEKEQMYAFYHKVVLSSAISAFTEAGWEAMDKVKADYMLKAECAKGIMYNKITGQEEAYLEDKSAMNKARLHKYISDCIHLLEADFGVRVPSADEFREPDEEGFIVR